MFGVQNCKIKAFPANANIYSFCKFKKSKYKLEKISKFKFNKGTIDTHSTIADRQHRVFFTFLTFLLSVVLAFLALSHNTCHFGSNQLLIQAFCEITALEVLIHAFVLLKQYTGIEVNWLIAIS